MKALLGIGIVGAILVAVVVFGGISWNNAGISIEETTIAQVKSNKNIYDKFWKSVSEVAQVPNQYKKDFAEVYKGIMENRYPEGQNPLMKWIKEDNPDFDSKLYAKIQDVIIAGRNEFSQGQDDLADKQRRLSTHLRQFPGSFYKGFFDLPSVQKGPLAPIIDLDEDGRITVFDYPIVTSTKTEQVFRDGKDDEPLNVFGK